MSDSVVLFCAVLASMATGILLAYAVCHAMFGLFRMHARQVAVASEQVITAASQIAPS